MEKITENASGAVDVAGILANTLQTRNQCDVARDAGLSPSALTRILRGERMPMPATMKRLAAVLGVRIGDLYEHLSDIQTEMVA